jgi:hypothetical protein
MVGKVDRETRLNDSNGWVVEKFDILTTTVRSILTGELATIANGDLAKTRITNMRRSDCANVRIDLKFGSGVPFQSVKVFRVAVENFARDRDREWAGIVSFRSTNTESGLGYVEYELTLRTRGSWQEVSIVTFCLSTGKLDIASPLNF